MPRDPGRGAGHHLHHGRRDGGARPHGRGSLRPARGRRHPARPAPHDHAPRPASGGACALRLPRSAIHSCRGVQGAAAAGTSVVGPVPSFSANRKCVTLHSGSAGSPSRWRRCSGARAIVFGYPEVHYTPLGECREPQPLAPV